MTRQRTAALVPLRESDTPGHPARGRYLSRQVSWLTGHHLCSVFPGHSRPSDIVEQKLIAYSCGGSFGIDTLVFTEFPLSSGCKSGEPRSNDYGGNIRRGQYT